MNNTFSKYRPPYFGQDIDPFYFPKISASIILEQDIDPFSFAKYRPPYFWNKIRLTQVRYTTKVILLVNFKLEKFITTDCTIERGPQFGAPFKDSIRSTVGGYAAYLQL